MDMHTVHCGWDCFVRYEECFNRNFVLRNVTAEKELMYVQADNAYLKYVLLLYWAYSESP